MSESQEERETGIKAVVFDLDGVLVDAREWHFSALNRALKIFGHGIERSDHVTEYDGLPTREKLRRLSLTRGLPLELHGLISTLKQRYTRQIIVDCCRPEPDKQRIMEALRQKGLRLAVASNAIRTSVETILTQSRLIDYFDFLLSSQDVRNPKPDPEIFLLAFERFKLSADQVLVIEDNHHGIAAAKASGARVVEVSGVEEVTWDLLDKALDPALTAQC